MVQCLAFGVEEGSRGCEAAGASGVLKFHNHSLRKPQRQDGPSRRQLGKHNHGKMLGLRGGGSD